LVQGATAEHRGFIEQLTGDFSAGKKRRFRTEIIKSTDTLQVSLFT
jgi:hypothetical protein